MRLLIFFHISLRKLVFTVFLCPQNKTLLESLIIDSREVIYRKLSMVMGDEEDIKIFERFEWHVGITKCRNGFKN